MQRTKIYAYVGTWFWVLSLWSRGYTIFKLWRDTSCSWSCLCWTWNQSRW